jgi:hypothetical protein
MKRLLLGTLIIAVCASVMALIRALASSKELPAESPAEPARVARSQKLVVAEPHAQPPLPGRQPDPVGGSAVRSAPELDGPMQELMRRNPEVGTLLKSTISPLAAAMVNQGRQCMPKEEPPFSLIEYDFRVDLSSDEIRLSDSQVAVRTGAPLSPAVLDCLRGASAAGRTAKRSRALAHAAEEPATFRYKWTVPVGKRPD